MDLVLFVCVFQFLVLVWFVFNFRGYSGAVRQPIAWRDPYSAYRFATEDRHYVWERLATGEARELEGATAAMTLRTILSA